MTNLAMYVPSILVANQNMSITGYLGSINCIVNKSIVLHSMLNCTEGEGGYMLKFLIRPGLETLISFCVIEQRAKLILFL